MDSNILLENGTNELEVLEFKLGENSYGINVAKVREIIPFQKATPVPNAHPCIEGIFMPRDTIITAINLKRCISMKDDGSAGMFIVTNFNKLNIAFHVDSVEGIHRISWADIIQPDETISSLEHGVSTGIVKINGKLIIILDFEKIVTDINPETGLKVSDVDSLGPRKRNEAPILIAEDSVLLSHLLVDSLKKAGFDNLIITENGNEALTYLQKYKAYGQIDEKVKLVITDIEMPVMDGHHLTKLIKEDDYFKHIPVIIFSSMINDEMRRKGEQLGADAQLSKPEIGSLVKKIDQLLF